MPVGEHAYQLRSLADAQRLRDAGVGSQSAVVIGAGFIGCEAAASLALRGVSVTLVAPNAAPQDKRLGLDAGERLRGLVTATGARYVGGVSVEEIRHGAVRLDNGVTIDCDLVLAATGVRPQGALADEAGLRMTDSRIVAGADMRTSAPDALAAGEIGDAAVKYHAWGDGYDRSRLVDHGDGFTAWYERNGATVGVLTLNADDDYERGETLIKNGQPVCVPG